MIGVERMSNDDLSTHVGITPHQSALHAKLKNNKILDVTWFLGKRCNFDCSYCSTLIHDNFSKHIDTKKIFYFIDNLNSHCEKIGKNINLSFTGGEPFVHPDFVDILKHCHSKSKLFRQGVTTNGSLPLSVYQDASVFLTWLTISMHLEQPQEKIEELMEKILILNQNKKIFLSVHLMALPGKFNLVRNIMDKLSAHSVKFVLKQIDPPDFDNAMEFHRGNKDKNEVNYKEPYNSSLDLKKKIKAFFRENIRERLESYYDKDELNFLISYSKHHPNMKLHFEKHFLLINSEELKKKNLNKWKGWTCFIGLDSLYIEQDGSVYRGLCMQGEKIGHIGSDLIWPTEPITCPVEYCVCQSDMCVKKVKEKKYLELFK